MKIVVLAGGGSSEREVSLSSAAQIAKALAKIGHSVCIVDLLDGETKPEELRFTESPNDICEYTISQAAPEAYRNGSRAETIGKNIIEICKAADLVFIALHGGVGENGKLQALFDLYGISYTGSGYDGCLLSMNKHIAKLLASAHGIRTANWCLGRKEPSVSFPCVVKPMCGGSSIGVSVTGDFSELNAALRLAEKYDEEVMIEEKMQGREFSVGILDEAALPIIEIVPESGFYDYKNKYQAGLAREICPAPLPCFIAKEMQRLALEIHKLLRLKFYSRIDFIMTEKNEIYFLEANSLPGMTPTSLLPQEARAAGISYERLCAMIAENAMKKRREK